MSRFRGPRLKIVRKLMIPTLQKKRKNIEKLPGLTKKETYKRNRPGQHGLVVKKSSQYKIRLQEKQKIRYNYGINERQLVNYIRQARKLKGSTGEVLMRLLEMRLDNIIFRLGFAPTIPAARQCITHGHFIVNNKKITIPSYQCSPQTEITVRKNENSRNLINNFLKKTKRILIPSHLNQEKNLLVGKINRFVEKKNIGLKLNELLVIEYYSRKI